jgi:hypothetical protein
MTKDIEEAKERLAELTAMKFDLDVLLDLSRKTGARLRRIVNSKQWRGYFAGDSKRKAVFKKYLEDDTHYCFHLCFILRDTHKKTLKLKRELRRIRAE